MPSPATAAADVSRITTRIFMVRALLSFRLLLAAACCGALAAQRTPDEALRALQDGNERFAADRTVQRALGDGARRSLARSPGPFAVVLCCADSQLPPEHVFNAGLGDLVVVRVAGHAVDAETVASIEHAVEALAVPLCVVLAHEQCGAIAAAAARDGADRDRAVSPAFRAVLDQLEPAVRAAKARELRGRELLAASEEEHAQLTVHECLRRSNTLRTFAAAGRLRIVAARCHLASGAVEWLPSRPLPAAPEAAAAPPEPGSVPASLPPHTALRLLQAGHRRFLGDGRPTGDVTAARREALLHGQQPVAIVLTCCDARVAPEHLFDAGLGELFVVRVGGGVLTERALASIEHAAAGLGSPLLVVMAHTKCDAVQAAARQPGSALSPNARTLLLHLEPSVAAARRDAGGADLADAAAAAHAQRVVNEARSRSAVLRALEDQGRFQMLACVYDIASGDLRWLEDAAPVEAPPVPSAPTAVELAAPAGETAPREEHEVPAEPVPPVRSEPPAAAASPRAPARAPLTPHAPDLRWAGGVVGVVSLLAAILLAIKQR